MANKKITDLTTLTTPADDDLLYIVDVSDTTGSANGTSKAISKSDLVSGEYFTVNSASYVSASIEMALTMGASTSDGTTFSYITTFIIPLNCRLINVKTASQSNGGSTDMRPYKPTGDSSISLFTELGTVNVASHTLGTTHTFTFDTATYDYTAGERLGLTIDSTTSLNGFRYTLLFKLT